MSSRIRVTINVVLVFFALLLPGFPVLTAVHGGDKILLDVRHSGQSFGYLTTFFYNLQEEGYSIDYYTPSSDILTARQLKDYSAVFIEGALHGVPFSAQEIQLLVQYVEDGGGLLLDPKGGAWVADNSTDQIGKHTIENYPLNELSKEFGVVSNPDFFADEFHKEPPLYAPDCFGDHEITRGINGVSYVNQILSTLNVSDPFTIAVRGSEDSYSVGVDWSWYFHKYGERPPLTAAIEFGSGRVVVGIPADVWDGDDDKNGSSDFLEFDNLQMGLNIFAWLSGRHVGYGHAPEVAAFVIVQDATGDVYDYNQLGVPAPPSMDLVMAGVEELRMSNVTMLRFKIQAADDIVHYLSHQIQECQSAFCPSISFVWELDTDRNPATGMYKIDGIGVDESIRVYYVPDRNRWVGEKTSSQPLDWRKEIPESSFTVSGDTVSVLVFLADLRTPSSFDWVAACAEYWTFFLTRPNYHDYVPDKEHATFTISTALTGVELPKITSTSKTTSLPSTIPTEQPSAVATPVITQGVLTAFLVSVTGGLFVAFATRADLRASFLRLVRRLAKYLRPSSG